MATALRILCVHGVGQHPPGGAWQQAWEAATARRAAESPAAAVVFTAPSAGRTLDG